MDMHFADSLIQTSKVEAQFHINPDVSYLLLKDLHRRRLIKKYYKIFMELFVTFSM